MTERIRVKARITTLGIDAGTHVEIDNTPAVQRKLHAGWLVELVKADGDREGVSERNRSAVQRSRRADRKGSSSGSD